ncbi:MAG: hypothetical protein H7A38_00905 [Chlamydiales bacterium]|nr:hypothetical protein [Chlamydiales bacterium]
MKELLLKILVLLGLGLGVNAGETLQFSFRLPSYPEEDRDLSLVQKFFISQVERKVEGVRTLFEDGELIVEGDHKQLEAFANGFTHWIKEPLMQEEFEEAKNLYLKELESLGDLDNSALVGEMSYGMALNGRESLIPLNQLLQYALVSLASSPEIALVSEQPNYQLYYRLQMSEEQQNATAKLIKKMADAGYWELLKIRKEMDKIGDKVQPVHPLRFIGFIYGNPGLKKRMPKILDDIFKRRGFLNGHGQKEGFAQRMTKEDHNHNLMQYLPGFAQSLGIPQQSIESYFYRHDWEGLLRHLAK